MIDVNIRAGARYLITPVLIEIIRVDIMIFIFAATAIVEITTRGSNVISLVGPSLDISVELINFHQGENQEWIPSNAMRLSKTYCRM